MLEDSKLVATIGTGDIDAAKAFYTDTLGLKPMIDLGDAIAYLQPDGSSLFVYLRPDHKAPENTVVTFAVPVDRFDAIRGELASKGITFEEYDLEFSPMVDGVAQGPDGSKISWFKDPDGQIVSLTGMPG